MVILSEVCCMKNLISTVAGILSGFAFIFLVVILKMRFIPEFDFLI